MSIAKKTLYRRLQSLLYLKNNLASLAAWRDRILE